MSNLNEEGMELLDGEQITEFNKFRMENLTFKPNLSNQDIFWKKSFLRFSKWSNL